jgi:hypothetical protein
VLTTTDPWRDRVLRERVLEWMRAPWQRERWALRRDLGPVLAPRAAA